MARGKPHLAPMPRGKRAGRPRQRGFLRRLLRALDDQHLQLLTIQVPRERTQSVVIAVVIGLAALALVLLIIGGGGAPAPRKPQGLRARRQGVLWPGGNNLQRAPSRAGPNGALADVMPRPAPPTKEADEVSREVAGALRERVAAYYRTASAQDLENAWVFLAEAVRQRHGSREAYVREGREFFGRAATTYSTPRVALVRKDTGQLIGVAVVIVTIQLMNGGAFSFCQATVWIKERPGGGEVAWFLAQNEVFESGECSPVQQPG